MVRTVGAAGAEPVSLNERQLLFKGLAEDMVEGHMLRRKRRTGLDGVAQGIRIDGRGMHDVRKWSVQFGVERGHVEMQLGKTRVLARVSCDVVRPNPDRPTDGVLTVNTEFSPMASLAFEQGRPSDDMVHVGRVLERAVRQSRAVDTEALCIVPGEKVWSVRVDIHILDDTGNVIDCACAAAIVALHHFRRPDVTVTGEDVVIPVPLSIHHTPLAVSFAFFDVEGAAGGPSELVVVDPSLLEEQVMDGEMTVVMNTQREVCAVSKAGGLPLDASYIHRCTKIATVKVAEAHEQLWGALKAEEDRRRQERQT